MKWYSIKDTARKHKAINIIIGGRGIGKTYSATDFCINSGKMFLYLRNTVTQLDECVTAFGNPFKKWCADHGRDVYIEKSGKHAFIYERIEEDTKLIGMAAALSVFENLRGVDLSDIEIVLFDEFIERRTLSFPQFETFANLYETINRNRELEEPPRAPLQCFLLSNAQKLANPILAGYGLIPIIENMIRNNQNEYNNQFMHIELPESEVSEAKRNTANYVLTNGSKFADEALNNNFAFDSFYGVKKRPLKEYIGLCMIDNIYIYKHKSSNKYYACSSVCNNVPEFTSKDNYIPFYKNYGLLLSNAAAVGNLEYSDFITKSTLLDILQ